MKTAKIKNPGVILLLWTILSCFIAIIISVKLASILGISVSGNHMGILIGIFVALLITPAIMILRKDLNRENNKMFEKKIRKLIAVGKYEKALKLLEANADYIQDSQSLISLKEEIESNISENK